MYDLLKTHPGLQQYKFDCKPADFTSKGQLKAGAVLSDCDFWNFPMVDLTKEGGLQAEGTFIGESHKSTWKPGASPPPPPPPPSAGSGSAATRIGDGTVAAESVAERIGDGTSATEPGPAREAEQGEVLAIDANHTLSKELAHLSWTEACAATKPTMGAVDCRLLTAPHA